MFKVRFDNAAIISLAAMIRGAEPAFPSNRPFLPRPPHVTDITPRQQRARKNQLNQAANRHRRAGLRGPDERARQYQINGLTNWQRSKWAQAGYPPNRVEEFLCLNRRAV